jgi:ATP-binding cassette, subfamily B (MDR/TAP), member 1
MKGFKRKKAVENGSAAPDSSPAEEKKEPEDKSAKVPVSNYWRILSFGNRSEHLFLLIALGCALASGVPLPLMQIVFGQLAGNFNEYFIGTDTSEQEFKNSIDRLSLFIVYLFIAKFVLTYIASVSDGWPKARIPL